MVKEKACIFISGTGSNLRSIIHNSRDPNFPIKINLVISNNSKASGINYAKKFSIPFKIICGGMTKFETIALKEISEKKIKLICLAGFMKILSKNFLRRFKGKIINIHPSLLPKYKGLNTHKKVLENNEKFSGCTVHYVTSKLDSGKIIMQKKVRIAKNETIQSLEKKILKKEYILYPLAIKQIFINL